MTDQREFLKEAGSNFILKDKILYFSWKEPFNLVAEGDHRFYTPLNFDRRETTAHKSIQSQNFSLVETATQSMAGSPAELNPPELPNWLPISSHVRTFAQQDYTTS